MIVDRFCEKKRLEERKQINLNPLFNVMKFSVKFYFFVSHRTSKIRRNNNFHAKVIQIAPHKDNGNFNKDQISSQLS